jgi:hypothetical protein
VLAVRPFAKWIAWLCLLLTVCSAVELVAHHHSNQVEASACQICVAAHSTQPTSISLAATPVFRTILVLQLRPASAAKSVVSFGLHVRPPPSV